jgi:hypothetical protein
MLASSALAVFEEKVGPCDAHTVTHFHSLQIVSYRKRTEWAPLPIVTCHDMTIPLTSRFSVSTISSTSSTSPTNGEDSATKGHPNSGRADLAQLAEPLASLDKIEKKFRRRGIVLPPGEFRLAVKATTTSVNIPPRVAGPTVPTKPLGLPPHPKAFLTSQMPQKAGTQKTAGRQYGPRTEENRANLEQPTLEQELNHTTLKGPWVTAGNHPAFSKVEQQTWTKIHQNWKRDLRKIDTTSAQDNWRALIGPLYRTSNN